MTPYYQDESVTLYHGDAREVLAELDGDPTNNRVCNLRYGTRSENVQDSVRHGTNPLAARSHCSQGHEFTEANTYRAPSKPNTRDCRECHRIYGRASKRQRRREAVA